MKAFFLFFVFTFCTSVMCFVLFFLTKDYWWKQLLCSFSRVVCFFPNWLHVSWLSEQINKFTDFYQQERCRLSALRNGMICGGCLLNNVSHDIKKTQLCAPHTSGLCAFTAENPRSATLFCSLCSKRLFGSFSKQWPTKTKSDSDPWWLMWRCILRWMCHILHLTLLWWITNPSGYNIMDEIHKPTRAVSFYQMFGCTSRK